MAFLTWTESMAVGVGKIDDQHRELVELVNRLHLAMSEGRGKALLGTTLDALVDYTKVHFSTEEAYFDAHGYPEAGQHRSEHEAFVTQMAEFRCGFDEDRFMLSFDVMNFLSAWLVDHISSRDKSFGVYLSDRGVV